MMNDANENTTLRLILGDQLNDRHRWLQTRDDSVAYVLMEVAQEASYVTHHIQKVAAFFAAMRQFADRIRKRGHRVIYLTLDDSRNRQTFEKNIVWLVKQHRFNKFEYLLADEYRLDREFKKIEKELPIPSERFDTEHFFTERDEVSKLFAGKRRFLMETFYRHMRRKHSILMDDDKPVGGKWNFDPENRNPYDDDVPIPAPTVSKNDVTEIVDMIKRSGVTTFGSINPGRMIWPITRRQALAHLRSFIDDRLPHFGAYQDAMTTASWSLFHSRLSFALNTKLISPIEVIDAALDAYRARNIGLQHVEGFIRQILGWREYLRGIYWAHMPEYKSINYFEHSGKLPRYYWDGDTSMNCMRHAIGQSLEHAYAHHIQRLMITGNFALLAGIDPDEVDRWYLGVYIDAIEWVEITNTRGMSQFADGGIVGTKPYVSSANYIDRMSDYCDGCRYDRKKKYGDGACPFNSLYWDFYARHRDKLSGNPRIGMMYRVWDRMAAGEQKNIRRQAERYLNTIDKL